MVFKIQNREGLLISGAKHGQTLSNYNWISLFFFFKSVLIFFKLLVNGIHIFWSGEWKQRMWYEYTLFEKYYELKIHRTYHNDDSYLLTLYLLDIFLWKEWTKCYYIKEYQAASYNEREHKVYKKYPKRYWSDRKDITQKKREICELLTESNITKYLSYTGEKNKSITHHKQTSVYTNLLIEQIIKYIS